MNNIHVFRRALLESMSRGPMEPARQTPSQQVIMKTSEAATPAAMKEFMKRSEQSSSNIQSATTAATPVWKDSARFVVMPCKESWLPYLERLGMLHVPWAPPQEALNPGQRKKMSTGAQLASALSRPPRAGCWLVPSDHPAALVVARNVASLRRCGWRVGGTAEADIAELSDKLAFCRRAARLGVADSLPVHYASLDECVFPCMLKDALGEFGRDVHIVASATEAQHIMDLQAQLAFSKNPSRPMGAEAKRWVLQEFVPGTIEHSATLLFLNGELADVLCTQYVFSRGRYVWPRVKEHYAQRRTFDSVPEAHLEVMTKLLAGFDGVCNLNYKIRSEDGRSALALDARACRACPARARRSAAEHTSCCSQELSVAHARSTHMPHHHMHNTRPFPCCTSPHAHITTCPDHHMPRSPHAFCRMCIFECNPRLGGDLACDAPPSCARKLWQRMEGAPCPPSPRLALALISSRLASPSPPLPRLDVNASRSLGAGALPPRTRESMAHPGRIAVGQGERGDEDSAPSAAPRGVTHTEILGLQAELFADDVALLDEMSTWSRVAIEEYFQSNGKARPSAETTAARPYEVVYAPRMWLRRQPCVTSEIAGSITVGARLVGRVSPHDENWVELADGRGFAMIRHPTLGVLLKLSSPPPPAAAKPPPPPLASPPPPARSPVSAANAGTVDLEDDLVWPPYERGEPIVLLAKETWAPPEADTATVAAAAAETKVVAA